MQMSLYDRFGPSIENMKERVMKMKNEQNAEKELPVKEDAKIIPISIGREQGN